MLRRGCTPTNSPTMRPSRKPFTAGMPWIPYSCEMYGFSSVLIVASLTAPLRAATASSRTGVSWRQGPHQGAQKSTTTGSWREASTT